MGRIKKKLSTFSSGYFKIVQDFRNLKVWQKAHDLTLLIYKLNFDFPREELFGWRNSLRKTCVDIPAFVAEGCGKPTDAEFAKSL